MPETAISARRVSVFLPVFAAGLFHFAIAALYLAPFHGDASVLVCAPQRWLGQGPLERVHNTIGSDGFDGTFYYVIAQNPLQPQEEYIDSPCYRRARIFYPAAAWLLSGGGDALRLLWVMPLLNLLATCGLAWLGAKFATHYGRSAWWGFLLPIAVNAIQPSLRNMTDPLSAMTVMGVLCAWMLRWPAVHLALWGMMAVLTREQNLAVVLVAGFGSLLDRDWRRVAASSAVVAIATIWIGFLWAVYGHPPRAADTVDPPLAGLWYGWTHLDVNGHGQPRNPYPHLVRMTLLTAQTLCCLRIALCGPRAVGLMSVAAAGLVVVAGEALFNDPSNYLRVLNWVAMAVWIWAVQTGRRWPILLLAPAVIWPLLEVRFVWSIAG